MGIPNALPARRKLLEFLIGELKDIMPDATWSAAGIARHQLEVNRWCLELGGHVRTGLEDNIKFDKDRLAQEQCRTGRTPRRAMRRIRAPRRKLRRGAQICGTAGGLRRRFITSEGRRTMDQAYKTDDGATMSIGTIAFASAIGTTIEWYDFFLYGVMTPLVLNKLFFPNADILISHLLAYVTFFVGFLSRPIGGIIFGHYGDRIGRKTVLILTLLIMGVATFLIGLLPTYASAGDLGAAACCWRCASSRASASAANGAAPC